MPAVKIGTKHQIVIPHKLFNQLGLNVGDYLEAKTEGNKIVLEPQTLIPKEDLWFHSKEWQEGEAEADTDIKDGNFKDFNNADDLINDLNS